LRCAQDLHHHLFALVEPAAARDELAARQEGRPLVPDIDQCRAERRHQPPHPAEVDTPGLDAVAALDKEFDRNPILEQRSTPLAGSGRD